MITYKLKVNCPEPRMLISDMEFVSGDVNAYRLEFAFYDNGERVDLSDKILTVKGKRADGVILSGSGQIDGARAVFVPANALCRSGRAGFRNCVNRQRRQLYDNQDCFRDCAGRHGRNNRGRNHRGVCLCVVACANYKPTKQRRPRVGRVEVFL